MDLLSSRPFWPIRDGLPVAFPPLEDDAECDVAIIGGGVSGALIAWHLVAAGLDVIVVDRREVAHGSTAGNTGLLLYELDVPLHRLARRYGDDFAARAYRRCNAAVDAMGRLIDELRIQCGFLRKSSLYVAAQRAHVPRLQREFVARRAAKLSVEWWPRSRLARESSLPHMAAILSHNAAQLDVYRFTYGLMIAAQQAGARIYDRTAVIARKPSKGGIELRTTRGTRIRTRHVVVAAGYESESMLQRRLGALHSTFALATEPVAKFDGWPAGRALIWDTAEPYLYLRTTGDNRVIVGGCDEPFRDPQTRDQMLHAKAAVLQRRCRRFFPHIPFEVATAWAGTFGTTPDGLPFVGECRDIPHTWIALGFGGNGTTFSFIAAEIIRAALLGDKDPDADLFDFERKRR